MSIEIRALNVKDVFTVARMLGKITKSARAELVAAIAPKGKKPKVNPTELGMMLVQSICIDAEEDLKEWMADLAEKPLEEFEKMPPGTLIDMVKQLSQREDIKDFLSQVSQLANLPEPKKG